MCGIGHKKTKQAGQRGTCQHSLPASHIRASRAHNKHHMAGGKPITHQLQNQEGSRCMSGVGHKKTKHTGQRDTCQHSQPASHIWASRALNKHHMAGSKPITHQLQKGRDPNACVVLGERKQCRHVRGAHASIACQHYTSGQQGQILYTTWPASVTHLGIEGTQQAPHGRQQADHSPAAESGGIQMHVWGRAQENKAGWSEGHMPA